MPVPVLCTVGLSATFWNMNFSVWSVLAAQGRNQFEFFLATFEFFFNFSRAKKVKMFNDKCEIFPH